MKNWIFGKIIFDDSEKTFPDLFQNLVIDDDSDDECQFYRFIIFSLSNSNVGKGNSSNSLSSESPFPT